MASAQKTGRDYLDDYFVQVVANFNSRLENAGISSLLVKDVTLTSNRLVSGVNVTGTTSYTNAIVTNLAALEMLKDGHRGGATDDGAHLFYQINFPNLTFFSDVAVDLSPYGSSKGTAELLFLNTTISVNIDKNYTSGYSGLQVAPYATMGPATSFLPISDVMDVAAKIARLEAGSGFLWDQVGLWCNTTFLAMISDAMNDVEFPMFPPF